MCLTDIMARGRGPRGEEDCSKLSISGPKYHYLTLVVLSFDFNYKWHYKNSKKHTIQPVYVFNCPQIRWRPVVWGLGVQVVLALLLLRVRSVFVSANWISHNAAHFLRHSLRGAVTAFGNPLAFLHPLFMIVSHGFELAGHGISLKSAVDLYCIVL